MERMHVKARWLGVVAGLAVLLVACGGDDDKKDSAQSTGPASGTAQATTAAGGARGASGTAAAGQAQAQGDCFAGLKTYRYAGNVKLKLPPGLGGPGGAQDIAVEGAFVSPDRTQSSVKSGRDTFEIISIGNDLWTREGSDGWTKGDAGSAGINITPGDICRTNPADLERAGIKPTKEKVNGTDALRYRIGKQDLDKLDQAFSGIAGQLTLLFDAVDLSLWVTEQEKWPLRLALDASQSGADAIAISLQFDVKDFNKGDIKVEPPK
jgi:hypothetical protein